MEHLSDLTKKKYCENMYLKDNGCPETQKAIMYCVKDNAGEQHVFSKQTGRISFMLIKDHSGIIHHRVELPRLEFDPRGGREIFAIWTPVMDDDRLGKYFITDANALELMSRPVFISQTASFSSSFYPVTSVISLQSEKGKLLTVWNDRP